MVSNVKLQYIRSLSAVLFILFSITGTVWAQSETKPEYKVQAVADSEIYRVVANQAIPPSNWQKFLNDALLFPLELKEDSLSVRIIVEFIVEKDGSLSKARVLRSEGLINNNKATAEQLKPFADEAIRVISIAPKWKPAINDGRTVRSYFTLPISFRTS